MKLRDLPHDDEEDDNLEDDDEDDDNDNMEIQEDTEEGMHWLENI